MIVAGAFAFAIGTMSVPVIGVVASASALALHEPLGPGQIVALAFTLAGVARRGHNDKGRRTGMRRPANRTDGQLGLRAGVPVAVVAKIGS
jgi:hypothetical protein